VADDFAAERYVVCVWDEQGNVPYGRAEVDVSGATAALGVGWTNPGSCQAEPIGHTP
jgi:hypothetical protein